MSLVQARRTLVLLLIEVLVALSGSAQNSKQKRIDSLNAQLQIDSARIYGYKKFRPFLRYSERNSIENPHPVNFYGPQLGILVNEYHIFGTGLYSSSPRTMQFYTYKDGNINSTEGIDIRYGSLFYEYILLQKRYFEIHVPLEFCYGYYHAAYKDSTDFIYRSVNEDLFMLCGGILGILKPLRWIGIIGSLGFREGTQPVVGGFYYSIGVWLGIRNLKSDVSYHLIRKKRYRRSVKEVLQL